MSLASLRESSRRSARSRSPVISPRRSSRSPGCSSRASFSARFVRLRLGMLGSLVRRGWVGEGGVYDLLHHLVGGPPRRLAHEYLDGKCRLCSPHEGSPRLLV